MLSALALALPAQAETCNALQAQLSSRENIKTYLQQETARDVNCAIALMADGQESSYCYAIFDYRTTDARDAFNLLNTNLSNCFTAKSQKGAGGLVNHPDSFDQNQFCAPNAHLSLSLKDKGNLNQTLVFLRLDGTSAPDSACQ